MVEDDEAETRIMPSEAQEHTPTLSSRQVAEMARPSVEAAARSRTRTLKSATLAPPPSRKALWAAVALGMVAAGAVAALWMREGEPVAPAPPNAMPPPAPKTPAVEITASITPPHARALLDGTPVESLGGVHALPCPAKGHHELRLEAPGYVPEVRTVPCQGLAVIDVVLQPER